MTSIQTDFLTDKGAQFSPCRTWRYSLWRTWDRDKGHIMFIGLNPSTADELKDDPTVRRCINYARDWGYGGIHMLNIFAYRATDPKELRSASDPIGHENNIFLQMYSACSRMVVACWGVHGTFQNRDKQVIDLLSDLYCLGLTKNGHPKHPLYLPKNSLPKRYYADFHDTNSAVALVEGLK